MQPASPDREEEAVSVCPNCGAGRPSQFCPECGERAVGAKEFGLLYFSGQATAGLTTLDGKLIGSLRRLLFRPGELTSDWMRGVRVRHLRPFQLFLLVNLLVVVVDRLWGLPGLSSHSYADAVAPWEEAMKAQAIQLGLSSVDYQQLYVAKGSEITRSTVVLLVPIAAAISALIHLRSERRTGVHLVFATHLIAFLLLIPDLLVMGLIHPWIRGLRGPDTGAAFMSLMVAMPVLVMSVWWFAGNRRVFGGRRWVAGIQAAVGTILFWLVGTLIHQYVTFRLTLWALSKD